LSPSALPSFCPTMKNELPLNPVVRLSPKMMAAWPFPDGSLDAIASVLSLESITNTVCSCLSGSELLPRSSR